MDVDDAKKFRSLSSNSQAECLNTSNKELHAQDKKQVVLFLLCLSFPLNVFGEDNTTFDYLKELPIEDLIGLVVTAQKRPEKLLDVPIGITVLEESIDATFSTNLEELLHYVPSATYRKGNVTRNSATILRGIGTITFSIGVEPSVSTVVDGVVLGRSGQAFAELYDLEHVEVLRGPQGTLFGKNASAGVINLRTRGPSHIFEGEMETRLFQDNEFRLSTRFSGPVNEQLTASVAVLKSSLDGYIDNTFNNETINGYDRSAVRVKVNYEPEPDLSIKTIIEQYKSDDDCCADLVLASSEDVVNDELDLDLNQRQVDHDFETRNIDNAFGFSVQVDKSVNNHTLTSITAYRLWENTEFRDGDDTSLGGDDAIPIFDAPFQLHDIGRQQWRQASQEIRIASAADQQLTYQFGAFIWDLNSERNFTRFASCQNNNGQAQTVLDANLGLTCLANDIVDATAYMATSFDNYAVFGQGDYQFNDVTQLILGLRYTYDRVSYQHRRVNNDEFGRPGVGVRGANANTEFDGYIDNYNTSGKLGLQFMTTDNSRLYATYTRGYKGPGFNVFYNMAEKDRAAIGPEESDAYELGFKYTLNNFFVNSALFYTKIRGFQANNPEPFGGITISRLTNAGDVITQGLEVDLMWQPTTTFWMTSGVSVISAEIDRFNCPEDESCTSRSGLDVPLSPDLKYTFNLNYTLPRYDYDILLNAKYTFEDEKQAMLPNNDGTFDAGELLPDYHMFNLSVGFSFHQDKFRLTLIGKNLTDENYVLTKAGTGLRYQVPRDAGRYFGVSLKTRFF